MSETLNPKSESLAAMPNESQWDKLKDTPFAGEQPETTEADIESPSEKTVGLQTLESMQTEETYRPVGEMEKSEIAREYMDLLHDLSSDFTSPEAQTSRVVAKDGTIINRAYSGDNEFVENLYKKNGLELDESNNLGEGTSLDEFHYENADLDRAHTLKMVDEILSGEQSWRDAGEEYGKAQTDLASAVEKLNQLQEEQKAKGFFGRMTSTLKFRKEVKEINATIDQARAVLSRAERSSQKSNQTLAKSLNAAYSPDYHYGHHQLNYEHSHDQDYKEEINEEHNNKFFGADDPARQEKINRALELRRALENN